jgi:hypothetical protein
LISFHHVISTSLLFILIVGATVSFSFGVTGLTGVGPSGSSPLHETNNEVADHNETAPVNTPVAVHKPKVVVVARSAATKVFLVLR